MRILIKSAKIVDRNSNHNGETKDILVEEGIIKEIEDNISADNIDKIIEEKNLHVSIGWFDFRVNTQDPGFEYKEDIESALDAAQNGGFTAICSTSSTTPPISTKSDVKYLINQSKNHLVDLYPIGTVSENLNGENISEMFDMKEAGAVAFSDNKKPISDSGLMSRALLYAKNFDGLIMNFPLDKSLSNGAMVNESATTTSMGLKGSPTLAEELMVSRDIYLAEYHDTKVHIGPISCEASLNLIKNAKNKGLKVTCEVAIHNLVFTDEAVLEFDSNFKVNPPYRNKSDRNALINGVIDGSIDVISTDHSPEDIENKKLEFEHAEYGIIGLQTFYSLLTEVFGSDVSLDELIQKFTINPRTILKLDTPIIKEGFEANLTLFNPTKKWLYDDNESKSENSPFLNQELTGKSIGVINKKDIFLNI